ncbi:hypothetical protein GCK32_018788 [Trichostrongylus colubriformis]|uniref:Uncharacterized protein n=1 Tax=Trichostrongylus colubriformis TaxID=6319 RepID=A0AAN8FEM4_TRICO
MSILQVSDIAPRELPNNLLRYYDDECGGHTVSYDGMCFYDPVQETDILGDDASEEASEVYEPGTYNGADVGTSSSGEEDDPELRELEERDNIVLKYEKHDSCHWSLIRAGIGARYGRNFLKSLGAGYSRSNSLPLSVFVHHSRQSEEK